MRSTPEGHNSSRSIESRIMCACRVKDVDYTDSEMKRTRYDPSSRAWWNINIDHWRSENIAMRVICAEKVQPKMPTPAIPRKELEFSCSSRPGFPEPLALRDAECGKCRNTVNHGSAVSDDHSDERKHTVSTRAEGCGGGESASLPPALSAMGAHL